MSENILNIEQNLKSSINHFLRSKTSEESTENSLNTWKSMNFHNCHIIQNKSLEENQDNSLSTVENGVLQILPVTT